MVKNIIVICTGLLVTLSGCSATSGEQAPETIQRTYPEAFDFERSTVHQMVNEVAPSDSLNADAFVIAVIKCPEGLMCFVPDGIIISDSVDAGSSATPLHLYVEKPREFTEDQYYRMSLEITKSPENGEKQFRLLGYSPLDR